MDQVEKYWQLIQEDPVMRYGSMLAVALLWFTIALANPWLLLSVPFFAGGFWLFVRYRGPSEPPTDDLEDLY